jgi:hypothetical protein
MIVKLENPNIIWTWLGTEYYRDSDYPIVSQILNTVSVPSKCYGNNVSEFISKCESEWHLCGKLSKGFTDLYHTPFVAFVNEVKANRDFLIGFLIPHQKIITSNLTTHSSLPKVDVKLQLRDIDTSGSVDNTALCTSKPSGIKKK